jgi:hypothetical protein
MSPEATTATPAPDPFDFERLRLADTDPGLGVRELVVDIPYHRPSKETFFRVRPGAEHQVTGGVIELKEEDDCFWVDPALWPRLAEEPTFSRRRVFTCVTLSGSPFLWGCRLPGPDAKQPPWVTVPLEAARAAEERWTKLYWDQAQKRHRVRVAEGMAAEPAFPDLPLPDLVRLAFRDRVISSLDHPVVKKLWGKA